MTHLTDGTGGVLEYYRYDAFGKPTIYGPNGQALNPQVSALRNRVMFTGREYVAKFGIYEYRNRAYHPGLGRFMSEDPKLFVHRASLGKEPDKWDFLKHPDDGEINLFRYVGNDPLDFTDPMGLEGFINGDLGATEVERIEGNKLGMTAVAVKVTPETTSDGTYRLGLNVIVVKREVARKVKWHGREVTRKDEQMKVTAEQHEKTEHNKDWKGFYEKHKDDFSKARFSDRKAAEAAAKAATQKEQPEVQKANREFNQHQPYERWHPIIIQEQPH